MYMYVCMRLCGCVCMRLCVYVCMYACMYTHACMRLRVYQGINKGGNIPRFVIIPYLRR